MFYSIFLIFFALQKYYLMICSCTFTHMATERNVWKMRRTCTHLRLHHDPYVSRSQRKEKQAPDRCSILTSTWTQPEGLYVRFSFTTGASQEATQAYLQRGTYGSSHGMRNEIKASWQGRNSHLMLLTCRRKFLMCRHSAKVSSDTGSPPKMRLSPPKFPAARRRSTVLPPFQPCVDEVPHAVLDGKLEQRMHSLHLDIKSATIARVQERLAVCR